jgi:hypothetical protein
MTGSAIGEGQTMEKTDDQEDVMMIGNPFADPTEASQDLEIISATIDWSGNIVVCEFKVKGEVVNISEGGSKNIYYFNIDIHTENDEEEIWFLYCDTGFSGMSTETGVIELWDDDFTSADGTFTFEFDKMHFGNYSDVLDIEVRAQNTDGWMDEIRWGEGYPADDDDISDDDTVDDDTADDHTSDDDDDSPGFSFVMALGSIVLVITVMYIIQRRE